MAWLRKEADWQRSPFAALPAIGDSNSRSERAWLVLAGGLALILSRASTPELDHRFSKSRELYEELHQQCASRQRIQIDPELMSDVVHEIAGVADPMTAAAAKACFHVSISRIRLQQPQRRNTDAACSTSPRTSMAPPGDSRQGSTTRCNLELLLERSSRLRETVAWARTTTFGNPDAQRS